MTTRIAITGANSSVGQALLGRVASDDGADIEARAGVRRQAAADGLPQSPRITPCVMRYDDPASVASLVEGASCLVHLAGILIESSSTSYQSANVEATRSVVDACRRAGVGHVVFVSALGADPGSSNGYYRSKGEAERIVAESGIPATIIRTPILLGAGTAGARSLVGLASRDAVKVLGGGHQTLQPLDIDDLSTAILRCCRARPEGVTTHELVGPEPVTQRELITTLAQRMGREVSVGGVPVWLAKLGATVTGWFRTGGMTPAVIDVITSDETVQDNADAELGVSLTPLSETLRRMVEERAGT